MTEGITILFLGLPRSVDVFFTSIDDFNKLKEEGVISRIIFSTWEGRIDKNLLLKLDNKGVEVLLNVEPQIPGKGSINVQMKALEEGLIACNLNELILKTRTDVYIKPEFIRELFKRYIADSKVRNASIFDHKIWIPAFEVTKPFYLSDEVFMGYCDDLKQLVNYDSTWDAAYGRDGGGETHIRRYIYPFLKKFPCLKSYKERLISTDLYIGPNALGKADRIRARLTESEYLNYLAIYYYVMMKYFLVYSDAHSLNWHQPYCKKNSRFNSDTFESTLLTPTGPHQSTWCNGMEWLNNLYNKKFKCALADNILERIGDIDD